MKRRDIPKAVFVSVAGSTLSTRETHPRTCSRPCFPLAGTETKADVIDYAYPPGNARRYGAVGDGLADDTEALRTLFTVMLRNGGDVGLLPTGRYRVSSTLALTLTPKSKASSATKGFTLSAYGATIHFTGSGYALDLYSPNTSAEFLLPQLTIAGLNIECTPAAAGGIRINDLSSGRLTDVFVHRATAGAAFTLRNTQTWCENIRIVSCGAVHCFNGVTFERINDEDPDHPSTPSFARTYVNHFFGAAITNYWFLINENCAVYDSQFEHISGNFTSRAYFAVAGDMTGSIIYGIHAEVNATVPGQGAIRILNYPKSSGVWRRPVLVNLGQLAVFTGKGTIPTWTNGCGEAIAGPEPLQRQVLGAETVLVAPAPTVLPGQIGWGNETAKRATAGRAGPAPAQVAGYIVVNIGGTNYKVPYYPV